MYCVSIDPGETTGIALVPYEEQPWNLTLIELGPSDHHLRLLRLLSLWRPQHILCETFENRGQDAAILTSCELIGVVKVYWQANKSLVHWQSASTGKQFWTDEKLKAYDLWAVGLRHARDAMRHYLYYRTFNLADQSLLKRDAKATVLRDVATK